MTTGTKLVKSVTGRSLTTLTEARKVEVLKMVREGKTAKEISDALNVTYSVVLDWRNMHIINEWNRADMLYQLDTVEAFSKRLMAESAGKKDTGLKAIQQKEAEFLRKQLVVAKTKYNDTPQIAIQVNLPSPIVDLGKLESE